MGRTGARGRKTSKKDTPLLEGIPSLVRLPHVWRAVVSVTFWCWRRPSARRLRCCCRGGSRGKHGDRWTPNIDAPTPIPDKAVLESSEPEAEDDCHSHASEESTDQNLPHDSDLDEDELLGLPTDVSHTRGALGWLRSPRGLPEGWWPISVIFVSRPMLGLKPAGSGSFEPAPLTSSNSFYFWFICLY